MGQAGKTGAGRKYSSTLTLVLSAALGGSGAGGNDTQSAQLTETQARSAIASTLINPQEDVTVQAGFSPLQSITCDVLGGRTPDGALVCVRYDAGGSLDGLPSESPDGVDYVLDSARVFARGESYKQVPRTLVISPSTVTNHANAIYAPLGVTGGGEFAKLLAVRPA